MCCLALIVPPGVYASVPYKQQVSFHRLDIERRGENGERRGEWRKHGVSRKENTDEERK
jgi:hypothetical protein